MAISVGTGAETQAPVTQNELQPSTSATTVPATSRPQSGIPSAALNSGQGIALSSTPVTTLNLSARTAVPSNNQASEKSHISVSVLALGAGLIIAAILLFWLTFLLRKKHNQYQ